MSSRRDSPAPARTELDPQLELVFGLDARRWYVRTSRSAGLYRVTSADARVLASHLRTELVRRARPRKVGTASIGRGDTWNVVKLVGPQQTKTVRLNPSATAALTPVLLDPAPSPDGWSAPTFTVLAEALERLELHTYLPDDAALPPKEYKAVDENHRVVSRGALVRGGEGAIVIDHRFPATGSRVRVKLGYADQAPGDARPLGTVILGVTRTPARDRIGEA